MADQAFNDLGTDDGSGRSELVPASLHRANVPIAFQPGLGRPAARGFDGMSLLRSLRRRWTLAAGLGLVVALVVAGLAWVVVPANQYTSGSILRVLMHQPTIIFKTADQTADYVTYRRTQAEMIKSRVVLAPALRDPRVAALPVVKAQADPLEWLEKEIRVDLPSGTEFLVVSMSSANPEELEPIVNAVVTSYLETIVLNEHKSREKRLAELEKLLNRFQDELRERRRSVRQLANVVGSEDRTTVVMKQGFLMENLQVLQRDLLAIQSELRKFAAYQELIDKKLGEAKAASTTAPPAIARNSGAAEAAADAATLDAELTARIETDPRVHSLRDAVDSAQRTYYRLRGLVRKADDPATLAARSKLSAAMQGLADYKASLRESLARTMPESTATPTASGSGSGSSITRFQDQIVILKKTESELLKEIERYRQEIGQFNTQTIDLKTEQDAIAVTDLTAQQIGKEVEALRVELTADKRIQLFTTAEPARKKNPAKRYLICAGASFGALALAVLGVSFWDMRAMRIDSVEEVTHDLGLTIVGALPALPDRRKKLTKSDDQRWQGLLIESIDATRTMLLHASRVNATRAVLITSAMKGEGKTSLAAHLATSLARAGRKTLLIDCDLRRPTLHQLLDVARVPGLCELLRGEAEMADVIRPTPAEDLNLMPAGHCDNIALQAIAQDGFSDIISVLKKRYDFIIVDSAPVLPVVDTLLLSQQVDAVLFSIMRDVSRVPHVQAAHDRIASLGIQLLGAVVSAAKRSDYMHSYNYRYDTAESS